MDIYPPKKIKITKIKNKGRGVVATEKILKDEVIEYFPLLILREKDSVFIGNKKRSDTLYHYYLLQPEFKRDTILLGYGSLYNHSSDPNCEIDYPNNPKMEHAFFRAIKDIEAGEEITFNYNFDDDLVEFLPAHKN
ncbi:MAG: SET domain-containing protein-lysine N-methyltransferase [bacterium]|nr:SET domain-containing protein-lysine N-methyltransferase [bacterium]